MKYLLLAFFLTFSLPLFSQDEDPWQWWNELHQWEPGMPGWRNFMILSPGYLGPNALPVPEMKKGIITKQSEFETTLSRHFNAEDPTQDLSARVFLPAAGGRVAFEASWMFIENYHYTENIRNERVSRDRNGFGFAVGDVYLGAQIQMVRDRKFPNTLFRFAVKTASGDAWAARFTDTPGYYSDFSFSKDFKLSRFSTLRPYGSLGFYSWQTYNQETPQNDALLYGLGVDYLQDELLFSANLTGYSGYLDNRDKPMVVNFESRYDWERMAVRLLFTSGLRDWNYNTFRFSVIWKFDAL